MNDSPSEAVPADTSSSPKVSRPPHLVRPANTIKAIGLMFVAVTLFAGLDTSAKYLATQSGLPIVQIVWSRFIGQFLLMLTFLTSLPLAELFATRKLKWEIFRSAMMAGTTGCNFIALQYLRLDQTITVVFLAPLVVALLAGPFLGEWVGWRRLVAILVGFCGILIVVRPGFHSLHFAFIFAFGTMLTYAIFMLLTRYLAAYDKPLVMLFYSILLGTFGLMPFALWQWVWPATIGQWALLSILGVLGGTGHYFFIHAYRLAPASILSPFLYVQLISMVGFGYFVFNDLPDIWTLIGSGVIIASGVYLLHRERAARAEARLNDPI